MTAWASADSVPDQSGRTVLVTGANSGLGFETARALAKKGAAVLLGCRNETKGKEAVARIRAEVDNAKLELVLMDLASLESVRNAAKLLEAEHPSLDGLVNNAGLMALPPTKTKDGFEMQLGTNHLGHFALTSLLLPLLHKGTKPRVVNVSSIYHKMGKLDADDLFFERRGYDKWAAYAQSKLANLLFTYELDRKLRKAAIPIASLAAHPGYSATELQTKGPRIEGSGIAERVMTFSNALFAQSQEKGALPQLRALTDPNAQGGEYYGPSGFQELRGAATLVQPAKRARDGASSAALWRRSVELTNESFAALA